MLSRREVLKAFGYSLAGLTLEQFLAPYEAQGAKPWWEQQGRSLLLGSDTTPKLAGSLSSATGIRNEYPALAVDEQGKAWICWVSQGEAGESILLTRTGEPAQEANATVSGQAGHHHEPEIAILGEQALAVWTSYKAPGVWAINGALLSKELQPTALSLSTHEALAWRPAVAASPQGGAWIVWEEKRQGHFQIVARRLKDGKLLDEQLVSLDAKRDNCRPAIACAANGDVWVAWDRYEGENNRNIVLRNLREGAATKEFALTSAVGLDTAPSLALDSRGKLWIAWQTNRWENGQCDIPRWFELHCLEGGAKLLKPEAPPPGKTREAIGEVQGFESVRLHAGADGRVWISGRASQNFYLQSFSPKGWSPLYRFPKDGWGGRGLHVKMAQAKPAGLWTARRDLDKMVVERVETEQGPDAADQQSWPLVQARDQMQMKYDGRALTHIEFDPWQGYNYYFGDIHGHTALSDGTGEIDDYFLTRRDLYRLDFAALTDHDSFVGNAILPSEWERIKEYTEHYNEPGRFATLFAQEWTSLRVPKGGGHINLYSTRRDFPLMDHATPEFDNAEKLLRKLKEIGAIGIPHHIGWTGILWEFFDPEVQPVVEVISVHGAYEFLGNETIPHRGGMNGCFVQDGLAQGMRFGLIGSTDCHGLLWQHGVCIKRDPFRSGWACVLAKELTREAIFEAIRKRRCYATSGIRARLLFEINGQMMGQELRCSGDREIKVAVSSESEIKWIEVVRDNKTIRQFGGEGHSSQFVFSDQEPLDQTAYYYLRVTCEDKNMAWSSPIWVTPEAKQKA